MIGTSGAFQSIPCPDSSCQRPYCHYSHSPVTSSSSTHTGISYSSFPSYSNESFPFQSSLGAGISQVSESAFTSDYTGYYCAAPFYNPGAYTYFGSGNDYSTYAPVAPSYSSESVISNYDVSTPTETNETNVKKSNESERKRKFSDTFEDPSKPWLPPELGDDPLLKLLEKKPKKEPEPPTSKKAKRQPVQIKGDSKTERMKNTEVNELVQKITEIDRKLAELRRKNKKPVVDVDALFDVDDEPPPKLISKSSSSGSSTKSEKSKKPSMDSSLPALSSNDSDIIIIDVKQAAPPVASAQSSTIGPQISNKSSRIAHVPSFPVKPKGPPLPTPMQRRQTLTEQLKKRNQVAGDSSKRQTTIQESMATMGKIRIAHMPTKQTVLLNDPRIPAARPEPLDLKSKKLSVVLRRKTLQKLIDEFSKFMNDDDAISAAQKEEHELMQKATGQTGYLSGITGVLRKVKEMNGSLKSHTGSNKVSHLDVLKGKHKASISVGIHSHCKKNAERVKEMTEQEMYEELFDRYLLTDQQLEDNGYPIWVDENNRKMVKIKVRESENVDKYFVDDSNPTRKCCRCNKIYRIKLNENDVVPQDDCDYHWGKLWRKKEHATWVTKYTCCGGDSQSGGCCLAKFHVTQMMNKSVLKQFTEAPPRTDGFDDRSTRIVALDCEMVYTSLGCEVARLSVVNFKGEKILDEIIKPPGELLDTNYRFSGLKPEEVNNSKLDLAAAQERFFEIINKDSILIGHSLESDLKAMRIVHKNVIDTTILYPHKQGPPFKRALKNLSSEVLMKIIQEDVTGHDSAEDAQITLELVLHKLMND